ncbi:MAG: phosphate ABC transporter permease PstA [Rhodospirillales bacterium]|nr:phosphate ABC transporter permease PstA [Rhodospirillales bacterium]
MAVSRALHRRRRVANAIGLSLATAATLFGLVWLVWILFTTLANGLGAIDLKLFTQMTPPPGEAGGLLNAIVGSAIMIGLGIVFGTPIGVMAGTWLAEYAHGRAIAEVIRFINDILLSAPSIVVGLFVYALVVRPTGHFSGWAGGVSLALVLLPVVVRTSDETMRLVPSSLREAALALGAPKWRMVTSVIWPAARTGITTGILLAIARISGETAPLLFTALNNQYWSVNPATPLANIPVVIFQYALSPYDQWHRLAWAGALLMTAVVLVLSVAARTAMARRK